MFAALPSDSMHCNGAAPHKLPTTEIKRPQSFSKTIPKLVFLGLCGAVQIAWYSGANLSETLSLIPDTAEWLQTPDTG